MTDSISLLAVGTIFVVVLGSMQFGLAYSRGEVLQQDPLTDAEERLHADLWASVNAERAADGGRRPPGRGPSAPEPERALLPGL